MRTILLGLGAAALAGCSPAARDVALAGLDLADPATLARLQADLPLDDRGVLATYALLHWPRSRFYCGEPIGGTRALPETIGEAIAQTRAYETALVAAKARQGGGTALSPALQRERAIVDRIDLLVLKRDMQRGAMPAPPSSLSRDIERELAALRSELAQLRSVKGG